MKIFRTLSRRGLALFLVLTMCVSLLPTTALAAEIAEAAHAHNEDGWTCVEEAQLICGYEQEHTHDETCWETSAASEEPVCGLAESEGHLHDEACYTEEPVQVCDLEVSEEHEHGEECFVTEAVLSCGQEESEGHAHGEDCFAAGETALVCELEEHQHSEACYASDWTCTEPTADISRFLRAVKAIPEEITAQNVEETEARIAEAIEAWQHLSGAERTNASVVRGYDAILAAEIAVEAAKKGTPETVLPEDAVVVDPAALVEFNDGFEEVALAVADLFTLVANTYLADGEDPDMVSFPTSLYFTGLGVEERFDVLDTFSSVEEPETVALTRNAITWQGVPVTAYFLPEETATQDELLMMVGNDDAELLAENGAPNKIGDTIKIVAQSGWSITTAVDANGFHCQCHEGIGDKADKISWHAWVDSSNKIVTIAASDVVLSFPTQPGTYKHTAWQTNSGMWKGVSGEATFAPVANLGIQKTPSAASVQTGTAVTFTITISNTGTGASERVVLLDILTLNGTSQNVTISSGNGYTVGSDGRIYVDPISPGGTTTIEYTVTPDTAGTLTNAVKSLGNETLAEATVTVTEEPITTATVTYNGNGGTVNNAATVTENDVTIGEYTVKSNDDIGFARDGYTFDKWTLDEEGQTSAGATETLTTDGLTFYAQWKDVPPVIKPDPDPTDPTDPNPGVKGVVKVAKNAAGTETITSVEVGDTVTYTVTVTPAETDAMGNPAGLVRNVQIEDRMLLAEAKAASSLSGVVTVTVNGQAVTPKTVALNAAQTALVVTLADATRAPIAVTYSHQIAETDLDRGNASVTNAVRVTVWNETEEGAPSGSDEVTLDVDQPDVSVKKIITSVGDKTFTKDAQPGTGFQAYVGETITWEITVTNNGTAEATGVEVAETFKVDGQPATLTSLKEKGAPNADVTLTDGKINVGTLAAGASKTYVATYLVKEADKGKSISNAAAIGEDKSETDITVSDKDAIVIEKTAKVDGKALTEGGKVNVGTTITYEIKVTNNGNRALTSLEIVDELTATEKKADGTTVVNHRKPTVPAGVSCTYDEKTGKTTFTIASLPCETGNTTTITYTYTVAAEDAGLFLKNAAVCKPDTDTPESKGETPETEVDTLKISKMEKTLLTTGYTAEANNVELKDGKLVVVDNEKPITLRYKITIEGDVGAKFTLEDNGATVVSPSDVVLGQEITLATPTLDVIVTMQFTKNGSGEYVNDDNSGGALTNKVTVTPGEGTEIPKNPEQPESKAYTATVKYVDDSTPANELQKEKVVIVNEPAKGYDVSSLIPVDLTVGEGQDSTHYALDKVEGRSSTTAMTANVVVTAIYSVDTKGTNSEGGHDNIPDKYQWTVTYEIVNGTWVGKTGEAAKKPQDVVVTFAAEQKDNSGKRIGWTENTPKQVNLTNVPEGQADGEDYDNGTWSVKPETNPNAPGKGTLGTDGKPATATGDVTFVLTYTKNVYPYTVEYYKDGTKITDEATLKVLQDTLGTGKRLANGKDADDHDIKHVKGHKVSLAVSEDFPESFQVGSNNFTYDATRPAEITISDSDNDNVIKVYYMTDNEGGNNGGDKVPDEYQAFVKYVYSPAGLTVGNGSVVTPNADYQYAIDLRVKDTDGKFVMNADGTVKLLTSITTVGASAVRSAKLGDNDYAFDYWQYPGKNGRKVAAEPGRDAVTIARETINNVTAGATYTYTACYDVDKVDKNNPGTPGSDGIPDKYEVDVTFIAKGGYFGAQGDTSKTDRVDKTVVLVDADGRYSETGSAKVQPVMPVAGNLPKLGYKHEGTWDPEITANTTVTKNDARTFTFTYTEEKTAEYTIVYHFADATGNELSDEDTQAIVNTYKLPEGGEATVGTFVTFEVKDALNGNSNHYALDYVAGAVKFDGSNYRFVVNENGSRLNTIDVYYGIDNWNDKTDSETGGDGILDKYQARITYVPKPNAGGTVAPTVQIFTSEKVGDRYEEKWTLSNQAISSTATAAAKDNYAFAFWSWEPKESDLAASPVAFFGSTLSGATTDFSAPTAENPKANDKTLYAIFLSDENKNQIPDAFEATVVFKAEQGGSIKDAGTNGTIIRTYDLRTLVNGKYELNKDGSIKLKTSVRLGTDANPTTTEAVTAVPGDNMAFDKWELKQDGSAAVLETIVTKGLTNDKVAEAELAAAKTLEVAAGKTYTYTAYFADDTVDKENPGTPGSDKIPDKYEAVVTFQIAKDGSTYTGKWSDGTTTDKTAVVLLYKDGVETNGFASKNDGGKGKLTAAQIPAGTANADSGYTENGTWSRTAPEIDSTAPSVGLEISEANTFVITWGRKQVTYSIKQHFVSKDGKTDTATVDVKFIVDGKEVTSKTATYASSIYGLIEERLMDTQTYGDVTYLYDSSRTGYIAGSDSVEENDANVTRLTAQNPGSLTVDGTVIHLFYDVDSWNKTDNSETGGDSTPDKEQVLVKYEADSNGTITGNTSEVKTVANGKVTIGGSSAKANEFYHFKNWTAASETDSSWSYDTSKLNATFSNTELTVAGGNVYTFTANFEADTYTVIFDANGGSWSDAPVGYMLDTEIEGHTKATKGNVGKDETVNILTPAPEWSGREFTGWKITQIGGIESDYPMGVNLLFTASQLWKGTNGNKDDLTITLTAEWRERPVGYTLALRYLNADETPSYEITDTTRKSVLNTPVAELVKGMTNEGQAYTNSKDGESVKYLFTKMEVTDNAGTLTKDGIVITLTYVKDTWKDDEGNEPDSDKEPDGTPDNRQILVKFVAGDNNGSVKADVQVFTLPEGEERMDVTPENTGITRTPVKGYAFDYWTKGEGTEKVNPFTAYNAKGGETIIFKAHFAEDKIGTENPDEGDGVPDKYQATVTYTAANGTVSFGKAVVTLFDSEGNYAEDGTGYLTAEQIPTATAAEGYAQSSEYWTGTIGTTVEYKKPTEETAITADANYFVFFDPAAYTITVEVVNGTVGTESGELARAEDGSYTITVNHNGIVKLDFAEKTGYALDSVTVDNMAGELSDGSYTFTKVSADHSIKVVYAEDVIGGTDPEDPKYPGDGVPDKYQVEVMFAGVNGTVDGATQAERVVTLVDEKGDWSEDGSYTLKKEDLPKTAPAEGYTGEGTWDVNPEGVVISKASEKLYFVITFVNGKYAASVEFYFDDKQDEGLTETHEETFESIFTIAPEKGLKHGGKHYALDKVENNGLRVSADSTKNVVKVYYEVDEIGTDPKNPDKPDNVPDKYQATVIFKVVKGTWNGDGDPAIRSIVVTLMKDGVPAVDGTYQIPADRVPKSTPDKGYYGGTWDSTNPAGPGGETIHGDTTFTYTHVLIPTVPPVTPPSGGGGTTIPDGPTPLVPDPGRTIADQDVPLAAPGLNNTDHFDYIKGYVIDGQILVRPEANITRAEVATIFFRLMTKEFREANWATENDFTDVKKGDWYNNAISTCTRAGILKGYEDGTFKPNQTISREEFAAIAARFASEEVPAGGMFKDIAGRWSEKDIERAAAMGWIKGSNGLFRPTDKITRAEVIVIVNRMLDRVPDADHMLPDMKTFADNTPDMWWYADVQEATNSHEYDRAEDGVTGIWTALLPEQDWAALEKEWATAADANVADVAPKLGAEGEKLEEETKEPETTGGNDGNGEE